MFLVWVLAALAEDRWTTEDIQAVRWPDSQVVTVKVAANKKVEVLVVDGTLARVRDGADFGWVDVSKLTTTPPPTPESANNEGEATP